MQSAIILLACMGKKQYYSVKAIIESKEVCLQEARIVIFVMVINVRSSCNVYLAGAACHGYACRSLEFRDLKQFSTNHS